MISDHPTYLAREIANLIDSDPVAARQIKEHIKPAQLVELLAIAPEVLDTIDRQVLLEYVSDRFTEAEVRKAFRK